MAMGETKHPGGRPTKYNAEWHPKIARALTLAGRTVDQVAEELELSPSTVKLWMDKYPEFSSAIKDSRDVPDDKVERALYELATGYEYDAEKPLVVSDGKDTGAHVEIAQYREKVPPNPTAIIFWLKNRRPKTWRDKHEVAVDSNVEIKVSFDPRGL